MPRSAEGEGASIDEAITRALAALGVSRNQAEIDILESAVPGLLGFGRRRARVRATLRAPLAAWDTIGTADVAPAAAAPVRPPNRFDVAGVVAEILRHMQWDATVRLGPDGDPRELEIASADQIVLDACTDEVLRALGLLVNRIAERHTDDGGRFLVTMRRSGRGAAPPVEARRPPSPERARRGGRGRGKPRR